MDRPLQTPQPATFEIEPEQEPPRPARRASESVVASLSIPQSIDRTASLAGSVKAGGAAPSDLYSCEREVTFKSTESKRQTIIFSKASEEAEDPETLRFLESHAGILWQGILIFVYMHFDAGLPLLQDCYKEFFGGGKLLFTKQTLLITQNACEIICLFLITKVLRGSMNDCINPRKSLAFAPAGACFGIQAVFGFLAMAEVSAECYAMYAQTSIIVLTLAWTIFFRTMLSGTCWIGVFMIAIGMVGFNMSDDKSSVRGLTYIGLKIVCQSFACIYAEMFIKSDPEVLYIQMCWMKPVELLTTVLMMFVIPAKPGDLSAVEAISQKGFFHDWNWLVVVIMVFNMGDTFMTATIAKKFDSVVKGVAGVADIIYPTQVFAPLIKKPEYTSLKVISGGTIVCGALNFVLAKGEMRRSKEQEMELADLREQFEQASPAKQSC